MGHHNEPETPNPIEEWHLRYHMPATPPRGDIVPVDVVLPDGHVMVANYQATVDWAAGIGGRILGIEQIERPQ